MRRRTLLALALVMTFGCASGEPRIRPEPIASVRANRFGAMRLTARPSSLETAPDSGSSDQIEIRCVEWRSGLTAPYRWIGELVSGMYSAYDECIYVAVDPTSIPEISIPAEASCEERKANGEKNVKSPCVSGDSGGRKKAADRLTRITDLLISYSDYNCNNFLARAFGVKTNVGMGSSILSTILSATATVVTPAAGVPALVPTGLNAGDTVVHGSTSAFEANYYANKSFDVMEAGILARREQTRAEIAARLCMTQQNSSAVCDIPTKEHYEGYRARAYSDTHDALRDVIAYDRVCSFEGGLKELSQEAAQRQQKADEAAGLGTPTPTPTPTTKHEQERNHDAAHKSAPPPRGHKAANPVKTPGAVETPTPPAG